MASGEPRTEAAVALNRAIDAAIESRNFSIAANAFYKYGMYLLLIGQGAPVKGLQTFEAGGVKRVT